MTLRGNYLVFYAIEFFSGILTAILLFSFGNIGLLGMIPFFIGLLLTQNSKPDEREIFLSYKINSYEGIGIGLIMGSVYVFYPLVNLFFVYISSALIFRGSIGFISFKKG